MASAPIAEASEFADCWLGGYRRVAPAGDVVARGNHWRDVFDEVAQVSRGDLGEIERLGARQLDDFVGHAGIAAESAAKTGASRPQPVLSPLPLTMASAEWGHISRGIAQRAALHDLLLADIYGAQTLAADGSIPAACLNGSPHFLRPLSGVVPAGGHRLHVYAADLVRTVDATWMVTADHLRSPVGMGYALENRLAGSRVLPGLQGRLHVERLAPFFADLRAGIAATCRRVDPRVALLTAGRGSASYDEQAHLARYLGLMLVEGGDLTTHGDRLYLRTIGGLKRIDALWHRVDARLLDPLAFDSTSRVGVAGLVDALAAHEVSVINAPGVGVTETRAFATLLPRLCERLTGEPLALPQVDTWWCGDDAGRSEVLARMEKGCEPLLIAPAFTVDPRALAGGACRYETLHRSGRDALLADLCVRPIDYAGQAVPDASTMPVVVGGRVVARRFALRVFAARDATGTWRVMPGGLVTIDGGDGATRTADAVVLADAPVAPTTLMAAHVPIRRNPGTLPSRVADNLFWLGRYLERAETTLSLVGGMFGGSGDVGGGAMLAPSTRARLIGMLVASGAAPFGSSDPAGVALDDPGQSASVAAMLAAARSIAAGSRERLSNEIWRLLDRPMPTAGTLEVRKRDLGERLQAIAGLAAEHMTRGSGWRFFELGRRIERALAVCRVVRAFGNEEADADDLALLLDLTHSAISYRQRYPAGVSAHAVRDLVVLDPGNPRGVTFQVAAIAAHLRALPTLADDGLPEAQLACANALAAELAARTTAMLDRSALERIEQLTLALSDAIGARYFVRGDLALRAARLILG